MRRRAGRIAVAAGRSFRRRVERMRRAVERHSPAAAARHLGRKTAVPAAEHCPNRTVVVDYQSCGSVPSQSGTAIPSYRFCTTSSHVLHNRKNLPRYDWAMKSFLTSWLIMTIAAAVMVAVTPGMTPVGEPPILGIAAFALFMALINASIKPIVHLIALPFAILSLGLVTLIINWLFMRLASWLAVSLFGVGVFVHGFRWSVLGSLVLTIVAGIVGSILDQ